ncbi:hypothetical protein MGN70_003418 [Eutypa lata]|nr:hypothetical protein MGN70_003418 [Eutypa lata]
MLIKIRPVDHLKFAFAVMPTAPVVNKSSSSIIAIFRLGIYLDEAKVTGLYYTNFPQWRQESTTSLHFIDVDSILPGPLRSWSSSALKIWMVLN